MATYYETHKERLLLRSKERYAANREKYRPARQRWAAEHQEEMRAYQRERGAQHREYIDSLKAGKLCAECHRSFPAYVLDYDHVRDTKRFNISKMMNHRRERILEEIAKCEIVCCACHRIRTSNRRGSPKTDRLTAFKAWVDSIKAVPCADCGQCYSPVAMDFDHVGDDKLANIANMWSWKRERVEVEIAKCQVVCANCHRIRTAARTGRGTT